MLFTIMFIALGMEINVSDAYKPLHISQVSMAPNASIYILNRAEKKVYIYGKDGSLIKTFAGPGPGPGELQAPNQIIVTSEFCYVTDWAKGYLKYDLNGNFIEGQKAAHINVIPRKTKGGWVYSKTNSELKTTDLYLCDETLKDPQLLLTFDDVDREMFFDLKIANTVSLDYKPAMERTLWVADKDCPYVYVYLANSKQILAFDTLSRTASKSIDISFVLQPFNRGWGEKKAEEIKGRVQLNGQKVNTLMNAQFPDYFPRISELAFGPGGNLWIYDGPSIMERYDHAIVLSPDGKQFSLKGEEETPHRVLALDQDKAYVLCFDRGQEHPLIKSCARKELSKLLATVPNQESEGELPPINIRMN